MIQHTQKPHRGTIIVDTCALFELHAAIEKEFQDPSKPRISRLYEILPKLANEGFKIVIPSIVLYETEALLDNGVCLQDYFPRKDDTRNQATFVDLIKFLKKIIADQTKGENREYPNIDIVPTERPEEVNQYLADLKEVTRKFPHACREANVDICKIQSRRKYGFGDMGIEELLDDMRIEHDKDALYLLSNNGSMLSKQAIRWPQLHIVDMSGFIKGLVESGFHTELGLRKHLNPKALTDSSQNQTGLEIGRRQFHRKEFTDDTRYTRRMVDFDHQDRPFLAAMKQLKSALEPTDKTMPDSPPLTARPKLSAVDRYNARWKTGKNGNGHDGGHDRGAA
jgi:hypothetical protein